MAFGFLFLFRGEDDFREGGYGTFGLRVMSDGESGEMGLRGDGLEALYIFMGRIF